MTSLKHVFWRSVLGSIMAGLIISGTLFAYPFDPANYIGHVLVWAVAGIVGLMVTLSSLEDEDAWVKATSVANTKQIASVGIESLLEECKPGDIRYTGPTGRFNESPKTEIAPESAIFGMGNVPLRREMVGGVAVFTPGWVRPVQEAARVGSKDLRKDDRLRLNCDG